MKTRGVVMTDALHDGLDRRAERVLAPLCKVFASTSARDKAGRLVQYLCHLIRGLLVAMDGKAVASRTQLFQKLRTLQFTISNARRTFRFYELGPLLTLTRLPTILADEPYWVSRLLSSICVAGFNLADRARWLQEHRLLAGEPSRAAIHAARLLSVAMAATAYRLLRKATSTNEARRLFASLRAQLIPSRPLPTSIAEDDATSFRRDLYDAMKSLLNCWQTGHIGKMPGFAMGDVSMGLIGSLISASDLHEVWTASRARAPHSVK
jgi:hypothetical protein